MPFGVIGFPACIKCQSDYYYVNNISRERIGLKMVEVTEKASETIKAFMSERDLDSPLRVYLQQGCGGAQLVLGVDNAKDSDEQQEVDGLTYLVDKDLYDQVGEVKLDFVDDGVRQGLLISSEKPLPQMEGGCGCGCSC
jgi:iron-sulfur cluster assembly accessory protein